VKQISEVIIDLKYFISFLNNKNVNIDKLTFKIKETKDDFNIVTNILKNTERDSLLKDHQNIKNILKIYTELCDFLYYYFNEKNLKDLDIKKVIEKIKIFSTHYAEEQIELSFDQTDVDIPKLKHFFNILEINKETFFKTISSMIANEINKSGDFIDFDSKYKDLNLLKKISEPKTFFGVFDNFKSKIYNQLYNKESKVLLLNVIDNVFKNINEDIKDEKIKLNDINLISFSVKYLDNLESNYYDKPLDYKEKRPKITFDDINKLLKTHPNLSHYYLYNDPVIGISKFISIKNEKFENRIIEIGRKNRTPAINYLTNVINELKKHKSEKEIFEEYKNNKLVKLLQGTNFFTLYLLLYEPRMDLVPYINFKNIPKDEKEDEPSSVNFLIKKMKLLKQYLEKFKDEGITLKKIFNEYPFLIEYINHDNHNFTSFFLNMYDKDELIENIENIKKYNNIYYCFLLYNYQQQNVQDHFNLLKSNKDMFNIFKKNMNRSLQELRESDDLLTFLMKHEKEIPFSLDELENMLSNPKHLLLYLYVSRKKLSRQSESIIYLRGMSQSMYNGFLREIKNNTFNYDSLRYFNDNVLYILAGPDGGG
jgi:hypothetical protein